MDDESPQPTPRPAARATKRVAPADSVGGDSGAPAKAAPRPRPAKKAASTSSAGTTSASRRRPPVRKAAASTSNGDSSVLTNAAFIDPLLQPVQDGTPVEIPVIVPAWLDEPEPAAAPPVPSLADAVDLPTRSLLATPPAPASVPEPVLVVPAEPEPAHSFTVEPEPGVVVRAPKQMKLPRGRRPRVRRVTRVVRQVDTWSVFKVALVFSLFLYAVCLTAGVLLWQVAQNTGTVDNVERFFESFGWQSFQLKGGVLFHNAWVGGLFLVVGLTGLCVLMATMFNLIAELVGGIRVTVLEEEVIAREERGLGWRRGSRRDADTATDEQPA